MPAFENPAAFFLVLLIPLLFILRSAKIFIRLVFRQFFLTGKDILLNGKANLKNFFPFLLVSFLRQVF